MTTTDTALFTVGEAAREIGVPLHRLVYAIAAGKVPRPRLRAGRYRLLTSEDVEHARRVLAIRTEEATP